MKKILLLSLLTLTGPVFSQTEDHKWAVGIHGGLAQYAGDLGNDFYSVIRKTQPFYGQVGFSVARYLGRRFDAVALFTYGDLGHFEGPEYETPTGEKRRFRARPGMMHLYLRYNILPSNYLLRPYVFLGAGIFRHFESVPASDGAGGLHFTLPTAGVGINIAVSKRVNIQFQETFMYTTFDNIDLFAAGRNDAYLYHLLGVTWNFSLKRTKKGGVGEAIDRCTDASRRNRKVKP